MSVAIHQTRSISIQQEKTRLTILGQIALPNIHNTEVPIASERVETRSKWK